jgi:3-phosphoshikimate 1-carboxyvinyltransferase
LKGVDVGGGEIPYLIDELPLVAVLGARAEGTTRIRDAAELRAKESDRIAAISSNLTRVGVEVEVFEDGLAVSGGSGPLRGVVESFGDHRIIMSMAVLGSIDSCEIELRGGEGASLSFPGFWPLLERVTPLGASGR